MSFTGAVIPVTGLNLGFVGQLSRTGEKVVTSRQVDSAAAHNLSFGQGAVILSANTTPAASTATPGTLMNIADFIAAGGTFTAAKFAGVAIREVKTQLLFTSLIQPASVAAVGYYAPSEQAEILTRGSLVVALPSGTGTPYPESPVYVRTALNGAIPNGTIGDFEAAADGGNTVQLTNVLFRTGVVDANGNVEITLLSRLSA